MAGAGLAAAALAAAVAWLIGARALAPPLAGGGALATLACALLARRSNVGLRRLAAAARLLARDEAPADAELPLLALNAESADATSALRQMVNAFRGREQELIARNIALGDHLARRTHQLTTLQDLSIGLAERTELHELVDEALGALEQTIEYASASVWAREDQAADGRVLLMGARAGDIGTGAPLAGPLRGMRLSRANLHTYERIERERVPVIENDVRQSLLSWLWSKVVDDSRSAALYRSTRSWMALPLRFREHVLGVLRVDHQESGYFDDERARLLTAVGSQAALAMRHAQLALQEREMAVTKERNRIARDLHDAVSQTLFAAHVLAGTLASAAERDGAIDAAALRRQTTQLERLNRSALAEMRLLMFELRPDALEAAQLHELLEHAIGALAGRGDIIVERQLSREDGQLAAEVRVQLYRIALEALSNIARHSKAARATVQWQVHGPGRALLRIADDGVGFDPAQPVRGHFGLGNMASRAAEIGAVFTLNSTPGQGTELRVELGG
jgi:signal transduction histidine kinase